MNNRELEGQVVLITGAGSGIGRSHALYFPTLGASVIVHDVDATKIRTTVDAIRNAGGRAFGIVCDVRDSARFRREIETATAEARPVDVLVNNVGIASNGPIESLTVDELDTVFRVNVYSFVVALQAVLPAMKQRRAGRIINTSSNWALTGQENACVYAATKAAILGLTKSWARELAPWNITVNCIAPGGIYTELLETSAERLARIPLGRHGDPLDVSHMVGFLASHRSSYMTGGVLNLTGGELIPGC